MSIDTLFTLQDQAKKIVTLKANGEVVVNPEATHAELLTVLVGALPMIHRANNSLAEEYQRGFTMGHTAGYSAALRRADELDPVPAIFTDRLNGLTTTAVRHHADGKVQFLNTARGKLTAHTVGDRLGTLKIEPSPHQRLREAARRVLRCSGDRQHLQTALAELDAVLGEV